MDVRLRARSGGWVSGVGGGGGGGGGVAVVWQCAPCKRGQPKPSPNPETDTLKWAVQLTGLWRLFKTGGPVLLTSHTLPVACSHCISLERVIPTKDLHLLATELCYFVLIWRTWWLAKWMTACMKHPLVWSYIHASIHPCLHFFFYFIFLHLCAA